MTCNFTFTPSEPFLLVILSCGSQRSANTHTSTTLSRVTCYYSHPKFWKRAEYCFESTVSEKRTHWASLSSTRNSVSSAKNSVSSLWHTNNRPRGAHWVLSPELGDGKTHWVRCLKPYSPKPYVFGLFPKIVHMYTACSIYIYKFGKKFRMDVSFLSGLVLELFLMLFVSMPVGPFQLLGMRVSTVKTLSSTVRVMDVRAKYRGHLYRRVCFPAAMVGIRMSGCGP